MYHKLLSPIKSKKRFYTLIKHGVIKMLSYHIFENIGAALGFLPRTGIQHPLIKQGGSSLISNMRGGGLVLYLTNQNRMKQNYSRRKHLES
ncbi:FtsW/RodA/SpoVE family cell cycle protein [Streptococcus hyointestinalis]|uniref:FtsW/RodA/SpoVE family cell cycle protein n=1 Tax=Streptococcus hyointestinalis TaxID=1337 RepID=UPI0013DE7E25